MSVESSLPPVVRIFANTQYPDYDCPWQAEAPEAATGSGVVVGEREILTGAHVVANATFLQVQKLADPDKAVARVKAVCHDADLALLEVADPAFTEDIHPAPIGDLPDFSDRVAVVGFPIGGEEVSLTEGVVSRIEVQTYDHSQRRLLAVTIDAAINAGNSGGPVFLGVEVCGLAFQKLGEADGIGEVVPATLIRRFLDEAMDQDGAGHRIELPGLGVRDQSLESPVHRRHLGLEKDESGVLVRRVAYGSSAWGVIEPGDVIHAIDGYRVANNGTVRYRERFRTNYRVFLGDHALGDEVPVTLRRSGEVLERTLTMRPSAHLVPRSQYDVPPSYLVWGGLVFQKLTRDFLSTWEDWDDRAPTPLLAEYEWGLPTEERPEVVVLSRVLADEVTVGLEIAECDAVKSVDGEPVRSLAHLSGLLEGAAGVVELRTTSDVVIVVDAGEVRKAQPRILERYHIPKDRSADLDRS